MRRILAVVAIAAAVAFAGTTVVAYAFDRVDSNRILPGVSVGGVDVGGMKRYQAIHAVRAKLEPPLSHPLVIRAGKHVVRVIPAKLGVHPLVSPAVNRALIESQDLMWVARAYHRLFSWPVTLSIPVKDAYPTQAVARVVAGIVKSVDLKPRGAALNASADDMSIVGQHSRTGRSLDPHAATAVVLGALRAGASTVTLPVKVLQPKVSDATLGKTITVDLTTNTLQLYDGFRVIRTYPVATAMPPYSTPIGTWQVVEKELHPIWINPGDAWSASMPPVIPPGPDNPLGLRALRLSAPGVLIHGTPEDSSIGHYASHGCIRMHEYDAIALYPLVPSGTKVIIFGAPPWGASTLVGAPVGY